MAALLLLAAAGVVNSVAVRSVSGDLAASLKERPVMKVVRLLQDMKAELEKEREEDEAVYESLDCWCKQNDQEKTKAIALGEARVEDLKSSMGEFAAKIEELREGLASTKEKLRKDKQALDESTTMRMQEAQAFHGEETDMLQTIQAIKDALIVLGRHNPSLTQLRSVAKSLEALKAMQMAKDTLGRDKLAVLKAFFQEAEEARSSSVLRKIPGFQSYTPQSGQIFGILRQMKEEFEANLSTAQKEEQKSISDYQALKEAKEAEIEAGKKQQMELEQEDAEFREKNAAAYEEFTDTQAQLKIDQTFLMNLKKKCSATDAEYEARTKSRLEELVAVEDTIAFLNSDDAFENFDKTVNSASFLQLKQLSKGEHALRLRAAQALRRTGSAELAALAQAVQLDAFTKVKAAIDAMVAELSKQSAEDSKHRDWCIDEMNKNNRTLAAAEDKKADLEATISDLTKTIETLTKSIKEKMDSVTEMQAEMKKASEIREAENADFQQMVTDQQITQAILTKALDRMKKVYADNVYALNQGAPHIQTSGTHTDPGNGPARFDEYEKKPAGNKVISMIQTVLSDAKKMEDEARFAEVDAQGAYESFMQDSNKSIETYQRAIVNMSEEKAKSEQALQAAKTDLQGTTREIENLYGVLGDLHTSCDFVVNNFDARQDARAAEIDALKEAKAILSGMK